MHHIDELVVPPSLETGERRLPELVTGARLRNAIQDQTFIHGGAPASVDGVKYDFRMGPRILKASFTQTINMDNLGEAERSQIGVDPGEVVFVMTQERLTLPANMIATLSPKRTLAHSGIIVLGGFAIDPNYSGALWMELYNFSSTKFPLRPGQKIIAAMFYELTTSESQDFPVPAAIAEAGEFPSDLVNLIKNYKPIEMKGLQEEIEDTKRQIVALRNEMTTDKDWKSEFKNSLDEHNRQLGLLIEGLKDEKEVRRQDDNLIVGRLDSLSSYFTAVRLGWAVIAIIVAAIVGGFVTKFIFH